MPLETSPPSAATFTTAGSQSPSPPVRLASIDAFRGLVMFLLIAENLRISEVARATSSATWSFLAEQQRHVEWVGCVLHDLIQPGFSFLVGAAMAFSIANRRARGQSAAVVTLHAFWRAFLLVALGVFLRSMGRPQTNYTFEDTLSQIGLGYGFLYLIAQGSTRLRWLALVVILVGYWLLFALWPLPGPDFDWSKTANTPDWEHNLSGFAAHWNKNTNPAWAFDVWFLNLFPRQSPFTANGGGYSTLSFIPTLGTMILGLIAGDVARSSRSAGRKMLWLVVVGLASLGLGYLLGYLGVCPVVKRIWTPSWVLFSGGWCMLFLAAFYAVVDALGWKWLVFPLIVLGMNSIAAYVMDGLLPGFIRDVLRRHLGADTFNAFGEAYAPFVLGCGVVLTLWLILFWMWRRKIFLKI